MATLDLTLDKMRFPGIENFNPEFGTKETMGRGVHSVNLSENDMMPFLLQRPVSVVENSSTSDIEADRKLAVEASGVTLTLGRPSYPGCKVTVYGSFSSGTATVAFYKDANDVSSVGVGAGERVELEANALRYFEVKAPAMSELVVASGTLSQAKTIPLGYASDAKLAFKVVFATGHNDATSADSLTLNGIAVVSNQNGTLAPIPHHAMAEDGSTVYKVLDPNTVLELYYTADYDGNQTPAFVIVGNPVVLSSSNYTIYADGQIVDTTTIFYKDGINVSAGLSYTRRNVEKYNEVVKLDLFVYTGSNSITPGSVIGKINDSKFWPRRELFLEGWSAVRFSPPYGCNIKVSTDGTLTLLANTASGQGEVSCSGTYLLSQPNT